jgi:hypothetical protein
MRFYRGVFLLVGILALYLSGCFLFEAKDIKLKAEDKDQKKGGPQAVSRPGP